MKKVFAIITVVVIFVVALFILSSRSGVAPVVTNTPTPESTATVQPVSRQVHDVTFTENGLSQTNFAIKAGETVKFINNDPALHWPASGMHPTHLLCLGFDSLKGLKQGESYSFTFNETGVCPFHDHLHAGDSQLSGIIEVSGGK
ncbi:MAG: hypothetical protein Q8R55_07355 [Candidatus Taylorbacteria bacterium]|nr:hypothetical protein [Candidatus Taylorbacteria bacterium]